MRTNFPPVEIYFVLAFTSCKLSVYRRDEAFARNLLKELNVEFLEAPPESVQEVDTRILLGLVKEFLPKYVSRVTAKAITDAITDTMKEIVSLRK